MAVRFAQPYRFSEQQLACMAEAGVVPVWGTTLVDGVPYVRGSPFRFSMEDYLRLGEIGVLHGDQRVELVDGEVIQMTPVGGSHSTVVFDVDDYLDSVAGPGVHVVMQSALQLENGPPVPDVMLLRRAHEVRGKVPTPAACILLVEVAEWSVEYDRNDKREMYARVGIPEYWVVDLIRGTVVQHLHPVSGHYQSVSEHGRGSNFVSPGMGGRAVRVSDIIKDL